MESGSAHGKAGLFDKGGGREDRRCCIHRGARTCDGQVSRSDGDTFLVFCVTPVRAFVILARVEDGEPQQAAAAAETAVRRPLFGDHSTAVVRHGHDFHVVLEPRDDRPRKTAHLTLERESAALFHLLEYAQSLHELRSCTETVSYTHLTLPTILRV